VPSEGRINVLLWYSLVGTLVGLLWIGPVGVSGCTWHGDDSPHLAVGAPLVLFVGSVRGSG